MIMLTNTAISEGKLIARQEWVQLLRASRRAGEHRYSRRLSEAWLEKYPGDIGIALQHAEALWADGRDDLAVLELKRICNIDPQCVEAQVTLAHLEKIGSLPQALVSLGNVAILTGRFLDDPWLPQWAVHAREISEQVKSGDAIDVDRLNMLVDSEPPTPLPALVLLSAYRRQDAQQAYFDFAAEMVIRWPDCLQFKLAQAEALIKARLEDEAVRMLHEIVSNDLTAQVASRMLGSENPYARLWPSELRLQLTLPVPASVGFSLGWNQLESGPLQGAVRRHSNTRPKTELSTDSNHHEEYIQIQEQLDKLAESLNHPELSGVDGRYPALIILSSKTRLTEKFGEVGFSQVDAELNKLAQATQRSHSWDCHILYTDDKNLAEKWRIKIPNHDAWAIKHAIGDLDIALNKSGERIGALLIIGGDDIIPFHMLPNPVDDDDSQVPSDNPYATNDANYFIPLWPVGRIPASADPNPEYLVNQIAGITASRLSSRPTRKLLPSWLSRILDMLINRKSTQSMGVSAQVWQRASHAVFRTIGKPEKLLISPTRSELLSSVTSTGHAPLAYYNLHGLSDAPEWFGQRDPLEMPVGPDYPVALTPNDLGPSGTTHSVVFTEACYGAHTINKATSDSIALKMLGTGTRSLVGSTCISYGSITTPLIAADLLGRYFWTNMKDGFTAGESLQRAKVHLAREMDARQGYLDGEDQKTLISFVLYGDPLTTLEADQALPKNIVRENSNRSVQTVCARSNGHENSQSRIPEELLTQVKKIVKGYLPGMAGAQISIAEEHATCAGHDCPSRHLAGGPHAKSTPNHRVVTLTKQARIGMHPHKQVARLTMDKNGDVVKLALTR